MVTKKKITVAWILAVLVAAGLVFLPRILHICDACGTFFIGTGYEANAVVDFLSRKEPVICRHCAEKQHVIAIASGKPVETFKRGLFD